MVVFVDLDDPEEVHDEHTPFDMRDLIHAHDNRILDPQEEEQDEEEERLNPNINCFSEALGCYPIISEIARHLDLNSLHDLSRACRQFRANLLQYRRRLIEQTLRCESEDLDPGGRLGNVFREASDAWNTHGPDGVRIPRLTSGKIGACARDMVGECQRCGTVVCRNCIMKAPSPIALKSRHRRICRTCLKAPLEPHTRIPQSIEEGDEAAPLAEDSHSLKPSLYRAPCICDEQVWICQPCGATLRTLDTSYMRGWTWRSRYSTHLHGLGTGIGEGVEGVQCGRESYCLAARTIFKEIECDARDTRTGGYFLQEIEGIGGVVKKKVKRKMQVGAVVKEHEDEREEGKYLWREQEHVNRSWCSWCARIVPSRKDVLGMVDVSSEDHIATSLGETEISSGSSF